MEMSQASKGRRVALLVLSGIGMFLATAFAYASTTSFQPFYYVVGRSRTLAQAAAFIYLAVVLGCWSALLRSLLARWQDVSQAVASYVGAFVITALVSRLMGYEFDEVLLFYVGWCSWWAGFLLVAICVAIGRAVLRTTPLPLWRGWAFVGILALSVGLLLYFFGEKTSRIILLAKVCLILLLPVSCALAIALRSGAGLILRVLAALVALIGLGQTTLR